MRVLPLWICLTVLFPTGWGKRTCGLVQNDIYLKKGEKREIVFWVHPDNTISESWNPKQNYSSLFNASDSNSPPELVILGRIPLHGPATTTPTSASSFGDPQKEYIKIVMAESSSEDLPQGAIMTVTSTESETETTTAPPLRIPIKWEISKFDEDISITEAEPEVLQITESDRNTQLSSLIQTSTGNKDAPLIFVQELTTEDEVIQTTTWETHDTVQTTEEIWASTAAEMVNPTDFNSRIAENLPQADETVTTTENVEIIAQTMNANANTVEFEKLPEKEAQVLPQDKDPANNRLFFETFDSLDSTTAETFTTSNKVFDEPNKFNGADQQLETETSVPATQSNPSEKLVAKQNELEQTTEVNQEITTLLQNLFAQDVTTEIIPESTPIGTFPQSQMLWDKTAETIEELPPAENLIQRQNVLDEESTEKIEGALLLGEGVPTTQNADSQTIGTYETTFMPEIFVIESTGIVQKLPEIIKPLQRTPDLLPETTEDPEMHGTQPEVQRPSEQTTINSELFSPVTEQLSSEQNFMGDQAEDPVTEQFSVGQPSDPSDPLSALSAMQEVEGETTARPEIISEVTHQFPQPTEPVLKDDPSENWENPSAKQNHVEETTLGSLNDPPTAQPETESFTSFELEVIKPIPGILVKQVSDQIQETTPLSAAEITTETGTDIPLISETLPPILILLNPANIPKTAVSDDLKLIESLNPNGFPDVMQRNKVSLDNSNALPSLEPTVLTLNIPPPVDANKTDSEPSAMAQTASGDNQLNLHTNKSPTGATLEPVQVVEEEGGSKSERIISRPKPSDLLSGIYRIVQSFSQQKLPFQGHFLRRGDNANKVQEQQNNSNSRQIDPFVELPAPNLALTNESRSIHDENHEVFHQFISNAQDRNFAPSSDSLVLGSDQEGIVTGQIHHRPSHASKTNSADSDTVNVEVSGVLPFETEVILKKGSVVASEPAHDFQARDGLIDDVRLKDDKFMKFIESQPMPMKMALLRGLPSRKVRQAPLDFTECDWRIRTEPGLYLLVTFHNLSAPYTVDCQGAYIEVERENNGYEARWCGNRVMQGGTRSHVIFARTEVRVSVYDDGGREKEFPTGFAAEAEVIDLYDAGNYANFRRSEAYSNVRRLNG